MPWFHSLNQYVVSTVSMGNIKKATFHETGPYKQLYPLDPRSGDTCAAGLLTHGLPPFSAFPFRYVRTVTGTNLVSLFTGIDVGVFRAE